MDGFGLPGEGRQRPGVSYISALRPVCVAHALGRIRKLRTLDGDHTDRTYVSIVRHRGNLGPAYGQQHLYSDRLRGAGGEEWERRPDCRRTLQGAARTT